MLIIDLPGELLVKSLFHVSVATLIRLTTTCQALAREEGQGERYRHGPASAHVRLGLHRGLHRGHRGHGRGGGRGGVDGQADRGAVSVAGDIPVGGAGASRPSDLGLQTGAGVSPGDCDAWRVNAYSGVLRSTRLLTR